jgi:glutamine---fructose-6-phosphate transaminase (isomerizing)
MCGIFAFNGQNGDVVEAVLSGIESILYRGYDSIGVALDDDEVIDVVKKAYSEIEDIRTELTENSSKIYKRGIGHNRWATVGDVSDANAHPHCDYWEDFFVVHNGNVENYFDLKKSLEQDYKLDEKIKFRSKTDTELIANLIALEYDDNMENAITRVMARIQGGNAFVVMSRKHPDEIFGAKVGSPLLVCQNGNGVMLASDANAFRSQDNHELPHYGVLDDGEIVIIRNDSYSIKNKGKKIEKEMIGLLDLGDDSGLGGYSHFMEKEIFEQARIFQNSISGRMLTDVGMPKLAGLEEYAEQLSRVKTFHFIGCGTAYNACYYAKLLFNRFGVQANAWVASEFCSNHPVYDPDDAFVFISQSGETADTIEVLKEVKDIKRKLCIGIVNNQSTEIPRKTDAGIHIRAGVEIGVASTKAYTSQLACIVLFAVFVARQRNMTEDTGRKILEELQQIPEKIDKILTQSTYIDQLAFKYSKYSNCYFLGRYFSHVTAMEGALKLKEISYLHAEGYSLGEMKHGPLALVDKDFASIVISPNNAVFQKSLINISELKAREGKVLAITTTDALSLVDFADDVIKVPSTLEYLQPILTTIPVQLLAYYAAVYLEKNPDKPRNLAKAVTVK